MLSIYVVFYNIFYIYSHISYILYNTVEWVTHAVFSKRCVLCECRVQYKPRCVSDALLSYT